MMAGHIIKNENPGRELIYDAENYELSRLPPLFLFFGLGILSTAILPGVHIHKSIDKEEPICPKHFLDR